MTPDQQLQGTQIALQVAQQMLADANARVIDLSAKLTMLQAEQTQQKAAAKPAKRKKATAPPVGS